MIAIQADSEQRTDTANQTKHIFNECFNLIKPTSVEKQVWFRSLCQNKQR